MSIESESSSASKDRNAAETAHAMNIEEDIVVSESEIKVVSLTEGPENDEEAAVEDKEEDNDAEIAAASDGKTEENAAGEEENNGEDVIEEEPDEETAMEEEADEGEEEEEEEKDEEDIMEEEEDERSGEEKNEGQTVDRQEGKHKEEEVEETTKKKNTRRLRRGKDEGTSKRKKTRELRKANDEENAEERNGQRVGGTSRMKMKHMMKVKDKDVKEQNKVSVKGNSQKKAKRLRGRKMATGSLGKVVPQTEAKPESSGQKKASKKAESMGMIFMCNSVTKTDCFHYKVLGLPANKKNIVEKVYKGMRLFLYDVDLKLMYGIYKATRPGGYNIEPKAFKSQFPAQVRFKVLEACLPLGEEKFRNVIKKNYYTRTKFDCQLSSEQVRDLCKLFTAARKGFQSEKPARHLRPEKRSYVNHESTRRQDADEERQSSMVDRRYSDPPYVHQREVAAAPVVPLHKLPPIATPITTEPYVYGRTLERDAYLRDPLVDYHDSYRLAPVLGPRDAYRREPPSLEHLDVRRFEARDAYRREPSLEHLDVRRFEAGDTYRREPSLEHLDVRRFRDAYRREPSLEHLDLQRFEPRDAYRRELPLEQRDVHRYEPVLEHRNSYGRGTVIDQRDLQQANRIIRRQDEVGGHDTCMAYRNQPSFHDTSYLAGRQEYRDYQAYRTPSSLPSEHRSSGLSADYLSSIRQQPDYYPNQPLYREVYRGLR